MLVCIKVSVSFLLSAKDFCFFWLRWFPSVLKSSFFQLPAKGFRWSIKLQHEIFRKHHFKHGSWYLIKLAFTAFIDQEIAFLVYQINEFILIGHKYGQLILDQVKNAAAAIAAESNIKAFSVESNDRSRARNQSIESRSWLADWATDCIRFEKAMQKFEQIVVRYDDSSFTNDNLIRSGSHPSDITEEVERSDLNMMNFSDI